jgi:hypothetical protein
VLLAKTVEEAQVDEGVDQRVQVGDGTAVPQMRPFNAKLKRLTVNALNRGSLAIQIFVCLAVSIKGVA